MVVGTKGPEYRTLIKRMPYTMRVGSMPGGDTEYTSIQAAISYANSVGGDHTILIYPGVYNEYITHDGPARIVLKAIGGKAWMWGVTELVVRIAPTAAPPIAVVVNNGNLQLEGIAVIAPDATKPTLRAGSAGDICITNKCTIRGVAPGMAVEQLGGTFINNGSIFPEGTINLSTSFCGTDFLHCNILGDLNLAGNFAHSLYLFDNDFHTNDINSLDTGNTTILLVSCHRIGTLTNSGTGAFTLRNSDVDMINNVGTGPVQIYGGYVDSILRAGSDVWWKLNEHTFKVLPSATPTDSVIGWTFGAAAAGDVILLTPGTYEESLNNAVGAHLKSIGPPGSVVITQDDATVLSVSSNFEIEGVTLRIVAPTANRYIVIDSGSRTVKFTRVNFEITTPGAFASRLFFFDEGIDATIDQCSCNISNPGNAGIEVFRLATVINTVRIKNCDWRIEGTNSVGIVNNHVNHVVTGGYNRWEVGHIFQPNIGTINLDNETVRTLANSGVGTGVVSLRGRKALFRLFQNEAGLVAAAPGVAYVELNGHIRSNVDFADICYGGARVVITAQGNEAGAGKGIEIYNNTTGSPLCEVTWDGNALQQNLAGAYKVSDLRVASQLLVRVKGSSGTENITVHAVDLELRW